LTEQENYVTDFYKTSTVLRYLFFWDVKPPHQVFRFRHFQTAKWCPPGAQTFK